MIAEFKEFIARGNMVELAVAFVMGVAFQSVISTITERVLTPLIAWVFGEPNFDSLLTFGAVDAETGMRVGSVGAVLTALINFLLVALALFLVVKAYNRLQRLRAATEPEPEEDAEDVRLLREIRDALTDRDRHGGSPTLS
ncbi:MAG: large conductance mechanosensitive channel protein MscL [Nitriliruptor sp.]|nr:MAG: large conductance mechanosensitive channel protein MscL [Nitriliruptor sp.]